MYKTMISLFLLFAAFQAIFLITVELIQNSKHCASEYIIFIPRLNLK